MRLAERNTSRCMAGAMAITVSVQSVAPIAATTPLYVMNPGVVEDATVPPDVSAAKASSRQAVSGAI